MKLHWRTLVVDGQLWKWAVGRQGVVARSSAGVKLYAHISEVWGCTPDTVERARWKRYLHITPADIVDWIRRTSAISITPREACHAL